MYIFSVESVPRQALIVGKGQDMGPNTCKKNSHLGVPSLMNHIDSLLSYKAPQMLDGSGS